jgi:lysozyme
MNVPPNAVELAKYFEGFYAKPYICPAGYATQGFGHLVKSLSVPPITREQGEEYLEKDLRDALQGTIRVCPLLLTVPETWLGAIVDFVFNLGVGRLQTSTLRRKINAELWEDVPTELRRWVYSSGRKLTGLILRREAEARYFGG